MLRNFIKYLKPYKKQFILAILCIVCEALLEVTLPFLMNMLIKNGITTLDDVTYTIDTNYTLIIALVMVGLSLLAFLLGIGSAKFSAIACRGFGYEIRKAQYLKIQQYIHQKEENYRQNNLDT